MRTRRAFEAVGSGSGQETSSGNLPCMAQSPQPRSVYQLRLVLSRISPLLLLYVDEELNDVTPFGSVRRQAFAILPKETLLR